MTLSELLEQSHNLGKMCRLTEQEVFELLKNFQYLRRPSFIIGYTKKGLCIFNDKWVAGEDVLEDDFGNEYFVSIPIADDKYTIATVYPLPESDVLLYVKINSYKNE